MEAIHEIETISRWRNIVCALGLHKWTKWIVSRERAENHNIKIEGLDAKVSNAKTLMSALFATPSYQRRQCVDCGKKQEEIF